MCDIMYLKYRIEGRFMDTYPDDISTNIYNLRLSEPVDLGAGNLYFTKKQKGVQYMRL